MNRPRAAIAVAAVSIAVLATVAPSAPAVGQGMAADAQRAEETAQNLLARFEQLGPQYLRPEQVLRNYEFAIAFLDASYLYGFGDWEAVSITLFDIVEDEDNRRHSSYDEAVFMLGDSLLEQRRYVLARRYFDRLANSPRHAIRAAERRLEIAIALQAYDTLDALYRDLESLGANADESDGASYVRGKALYFQARYEETITALSAIPVGSAIYPKARYFIGVSHTRLGAYDAALSEFASVGQLLGNARAEEPSDVTELRDLARLARGRIHYERRDWLAALDAYTEVPRFAQRYPHALYELSWCQIQQGNETVDVTLQQQYYRTALANLEALYVVSPRDSRFQADARLLRGDLLLRIEAYDRAVQEFEEVADQYFPVELELREIARQVDDPQAFFDSLINPGESSLRLPAAARSWFRTDPLVERAMLAVHDVETLRTDIADSEQLIRQLDAAINQGGRINAFPRMREGWGRAVEIQAEATRAAVVLVEAAGRVATLSPADAAEYQALRQTRSSFESRLEAAPRSFGEISEREQRMVAELNRVLLELHRARLQVESARSDVGALREMFIEYSGARPTENTRRIREQIDAEERRVAEYDRIANQLQQELYVRQVSVGLADNVGESERLLRGQFISALIAEYNFIAARGSDPQAITRGRGALNELQRVVTECESFLVALDRLVVEQTADMRSTLERERASVERQASLIDDVAAHASRTAGQVARGAFEDVHARFTDITLRASLGIIDVAWHQKERLSRRIEVLFDERNQSLRELDGDFAELLEDER